VVTRRVRVVARNPSCLAALLRQIVRLGAGGGVFVGAPEGANADFAMALKPRETDVHPGGYQSKLDW